MEPTIAAAGIAVLHAAAGSTAGGIVQTVGTAAATGGAATMFSSSELSHSSPRKSLVDSLPSSPVKSLRLGALTPSGISSLRFSSSRCSSPPSSPHSSHCEAGHISPVSSSSTDLSKETSSESMVQDPLHRIDVNIILHRLKATPLTGQVTAWAWEQAALLSQTKKAPPVALLATLWRATEACAACTTSQDIIEITDAWFVLVQQWPRHFRFPPSVMDHLLSFALPVAIKRMSEERLVSFTCSIRNIAGHRTDPVLSVSAQPAASSARDLLQPWFALIAAEVAWRTSDHSKPRVSRNLLQVVLSVSSIWRWSPLPSSRKSVVSGRLMSVGRPSATQLMTSECISAMKQSTLKALHVVKEAL